MKKIIGVVAAIMLVLSTMAYAGGDKVCGDKAAGPAGGGGGQTTQTRTPNP